MNIIYPPLIPDNFTTSTLLNIKIPHKYPARMTSKIADFVIKNFTKEGETILDPFCGSGSVLTAASANRRRSIGVDINPVAIAISKSYTRRYHISKLEKYLDIIMEELQKKNQQSLENYDKRLLYWFNPDVLRGIHQIKSIIYTDVSTNYRLFFLTALSSSIRSVSRADPKIFPPVYSKQMRRINKETKYEKVIMRFEKKARETIGSVAVSNKKLLPGYIPEIKRIDAFEYLRRNPYKFDSIFTSPPYGFAQKYTRSTSLELMTVFGASQKDLLSINKADIGSESLNPKEPNYVKGMPRWLFKDNPGSYESKQLISRYLSRMDEFIKLTYDSLKEQGKLLLWIGENKIGGKTVPIVRYLLKAAESDGFKNLGVYTDEIKNYSFFTRRNKNSAIIKNEYLIVLSK